MLYISWQQSYPPVKLSNSCSKCLCLILCRFSNHSYDRFWWGCAIRPSFVAHMHNWCWGELILDIWSLKIWSWEKRSLVDLILERFDPLSNKSEIWSSKKYPQFFWPTMIPNMKKLIKILNGANLGSKAVLHVVLNKFGRGRSVEHIYVLHVQCVVDLFSN